MSQAGWIDCGGGVRLERGVRARMRDGVSLVSDHYYPPEAGPQPTLLMRQPYGRDIASTVVYAHPVWFARHGYNVVIQDVRGRGDSEGEFYPFRNEGPDGAATIAWLRTRAESNGRVGMYGFSYQGITQLLAAAEQPEGLVCISPGMTACDLYHGWFYQGGALRLASTLSWGLQLLKVDARRKKLREAGHRLEQAWADLASQTSFLPIRSHPGLHGEGLPTYVLDWLDHDRPGEYWRALDVSRRLEKICVPALHISGWYDMFLRGSVAGFLGLWRSAGSEQARQNQYLLAGPWVHIPWGDRIGAADCGPEALIDTDTILLRWFDHWLKDARSFEGEPRIRHFVLGENRWRAAKDFPVKAEYALFLHSAGRANSRKGDGTLSTAGPDADEPCDIFVHDPEVPVMAPGGPAALAGQFDQATLEMGNNLLVYSTEPLEKPLWVFGFPRVVLYCSTSLTSTDFAAKLVRARPNGVAEFICVGIIRSSLRFANPEYNEEYTADEVHCWEFTLDPTSCRFDKGDRIRLEIASSAFPLFDRNPGSEVPSCRASSWDWRRSNQIVHHSRELPSALYLPASEAPE
jgi:putative CocE/NonD family hydrolase